jgi:DNA-binding transcriptional LysR family regulator
MAAPDLSDLDAVLAVAGARSFRRAAALRGVSASALSAAVRRAEARMGLRLLNRTTRSVTPTEAGARLIERLRPALADIGAAVAEAAGVAARLRLNVPGVAAELILPDLLARFAAAHPGIAVEVVADNTFRDVLAEGFDAGIRYGERLDRDMIAVPVGPREQRMVTAAAPAYLDRRGRPTDPEGLAGHRLLRFRFASGVLPVWEFRRGAVQRRVAGEPAMVAGTNAILIAAAEAGLGVIHTFEEFLRPSLAAGRLEEILPDWSERFPGPFLYFPSRRLMPEGLRRFVDFLKADRGGGA